MSVLALLLLAVGTADAVRSRAWGDRQREHLVTILAELSVLAVGAVLAGLTTLVNVALLVLATLVLAGWVLTSAEEVVRERGAAPPLAVIGLGTGLLVLTSGGAHPLARAAQQRPGGLRGRGR